MGVPEMGVPQGAALSSKYRSVYRSSERLGAAQPPQRAAHAIEGNLQKDYVHLSSGSCTPSVKGSGFCQRNCLF